MKAKGKLKVNKGKFIRFWCLVIIGLALINLAVSFIKYPEQYITTWKKALRDDLAKGNQSAIEYYNNTYVANGKLLFGNDYVVTSEYLNMATVVDYETSDEGVMLITADGNGYFIEK